MHIDPLRGNFPLPLWDMYQHDALRLLTDLPSFIPWPFFWNPLALWWLPLAALILDLVAGDPHVLPHPVRGIARLAGTAERSLRPRLPAFYAGTLGLILVMGASGGAALFVLALPGAAALAAWLYLAFAGLALGQLLREGKKALRLLRAAEKAGETESGPALEQARAAVQMLVSRGLSKADHATLAKTLAETMSENLNDAFVAPFFWLMLGGPVALWLYKAVSTLDSLWGYPHEPWTRFGTAAARLDDVLAYIPARLTALILLWSAALSGARGAWPGWKAVREDARRMASPNAGWPMSACAWLHGAPMGGKAVYAGVVKDKPHLGPESGVWDTETLARLLRHVLCAGLLAAFLFWSLAVTLAQL